MNDDFNSIVAEAIARREGEKAWERRDVDIEHNGTKITLPAEPGPMPLRKAIAALERKAADEETELDVSEVLDAFPEDAMVALNEAMRQKYGWASPTPKMSFFGPIAPDLITVKTGPEFSDSVQVPYGQFTLPGVENPVETVRHRTASGMVLVIRGTVRKREASVVKDLANLAREILKNKSIYKGKAIRLKVNEDGDLITNNPPEFLQTRYINPDELVLNPDELEQVKASLWAPVQNAELCVKYGIPLNRGVLLEGTYGTGKTMTANVTSKVCVDNGWTYILLDDVRALKDALLFAQRYQPAVVFAEDVDRVADKRDQRGNDILNTIDGVLTKNSKVITVLTTNHVEKLDRAMLRPGRLDSVISVHAPEAEAVQRLIKIYARGLLVDGADLSQVGELLAGNIPATIREVVERSKLGMIYRGESSITPNDLTVAAIGMERHLALLSEKRPSKSAEEKLGEAFLDVVSKGITSEALERQMASLGEGLKGNALVNIAAAEKSAEAAAKGSRAVQGAMQQMSSQVEEIHEKVCN